VLRGSDIGAGVGSRPKREGSSSSGSPSRFHRNLLDLGPRQLRPDLRRKDPAPGVAAERPRGTLAAPAPEVHALNDAAVSGVALEVLERLTGAYEILSRHGAEEGLGEVATQ